MYMRENMLSSDLISAGPEPQASSQICELAGAAVGPLEADTCGGPQGVGEFVGQKGSWDRMGQGGTGWDRDPMACLK